MSNTAALTDALLELTIGDLDRIEHETGASFSQPSTAVGIRSLLAQLAGVVGADFDAGSLRMPDVIAAFQATEDTLPTSWSDGMPMHGGRTVDRWIVSCAHSFHWPPDVTRRQTLRDLQLISESQEALPK